MPRFRAAVAALAAASALAFAGGCSIFKTNEEAQATINAQAVGKPVGDFFQQYGTWKRRVEQPNGSVEYFWESAVRTAPAGPFGADERVCRLYIVVSKAGRIDSALIVNDNVGAVSTSRCNEMFKAGGSGAALPPGVRP